MSPSVIFTVERSEPEFIAPSRPTPYEFKPLSDIDDQKGIRKQNYFVLFYRNTMEMQGKDPVKIIKEAIAKALVYYYPLAGRLREGLNDKLIVECTGEGVMFIEAKANVRLNHFGNIPQPPFPCAEELLYDVPGSADILHCPLLLIQVTRLICGGFIFALRLNHTMADGTGIVQFMKAVGEIACGANVPSVQPVWEREYVNAREPPRVSCYHHVYHELPDTDSMSLEDIGQLRQRSFFFGPQEIKNLRSHLPPRLHTSTKFEMLTALLWRSRTIALNLNSDDEVRVAFPVNARAKFKPPLPVGFYGNAFGLPVAQSTTSKLNNNPLGYAVDLIKKAKEDVKDEFLRSSTDLLVKKGRPRFTTVGTLYVSDLTHMGFKDVDFGWGKAVYGGPLFSGRPAIFLVSSKNNEGEEGIVVTIDLPGATMERFILEVEKMIFAHFG